MSRPRLLPSEFIGVFYPESTVMENFITACEVLGLTYGVLRHDDPDDLHGNKEHIHFVCKYDPSIVVKPTYDRFISISGISENLIRVPSCALWRSVKYLTHESDDAIKSGKHQYSRDKIITNDPEWIERCYSCIDDTEYLYADLENDLFNLVNHVISCRDFLHAHPEFFYKASSLKALIEIYNY